MVRQRYLCSIHVQYTSYTCSLVHLYAWNVVWFRMKWIEISINWVYNVHIHVYLRENITFCMKVGQYCVKLFLMHYQHFSCLSSIPNFIHIVLLMCNDFQFRMLKNTWLYISCFLNEYFLLFLCKLTLKKVICKMLPPTYL